MLSQKAEPLQSGGDTTVPDDGGASNELLRPNGRGLLQQRGACAADRPQSAPWTGKASWGYDALDRTFWGGA